MHSVSNLRDGSKKCLFPKSLYCICPYSVLLGFLLSTHTTVCSPPLLIPSFICINHMEQMLNYELHSQGTRCQISKDTESTSHNTVVLGRVLRIGRAFTCNCSDYLLIRPLAAILNGPVHSQFVLRVILPILRRPKNRGSWVPFVLVFLVTVQQSHSQGKAGNGQGGKSPPIAFFPLLV